MDGTFGSLLMISWCELPPKSRIRALSHVLLSQTCVYLKAVVL